MSIYGRDLQSSAALRCWVAGLVPVALIAVVTGIFLSTRWGLAPEALESFRKERDSGLSFIVGLHYWSSFVLIGGSLLALAISFLSGDFNASKLRWYALLALAVSILGLQITGNAMPMDQHDVQTVGMEAAVASRVPGAGPMVAQSMLGGQRLSESTIELWARVHMTVLTPLFLIAWVMWWRGIRQPLHDKPSGLASMATYLPIIAVVGLSLALSAPGGELAVTADYDLQSARPIWYVLPMHALLRLFDRIDPSLGWVGSALVPGLLLIGAIMMPFFAAKWTSAGRRNVALGLVAVLGVVTLVYGGRPAAISGTQSVSDLEVGQSNSGRPIKPIDLERSRAGRRLFKQFCFGCHGLDGVGSAGAPALQRIHERIKDPEWFKKFIANPASVKPGSTMPPFSQLDDAQLAQLAEFLRDPAKAGAIGTPTVGVGADQRSN
jgi:quinol-cytochrome oxidoreductase complex cytochrome b subunit